ncbi:MAG TPA: pyridoxamine 5'-phosphate oxidase family protein [Albitalea sp.]|nr:pyridoxamine 5'-phosphate oxidase family protein [Albitalea sp.]
MSSSSNAPFHEGEKAVQARVGVRDKMEGIGHRAIRDAMPEQHQELFRKLPTLFVGSLDAQRRPWASVLVGAPGFIETPDERTLRIRARPIDGDPLEGQLAPGLPLGLLGIEPHTRRRNRMNGSIEAVDDTGFTVGVDQSFGNCPKYIQAREPQWLRDPGAPAPRHRVHALGPALNEPACALIGRADTLFIASASPHARAHAGADGVDVSHRGGQRGFVRVDGGADGQVTLTLPDFQGNLMFNTLGNIVAWPHAGLLFIDHDHGDVLQLTGRAEVIWDGPQVQSFALAQRLLQLRVDEARWLPGVLPLRWSAPEFAPQLAATGRWP